MLHYRTGFYGGTTSVSSTLISSDGTEPVPPDVIIFLNPKMPIIPSHRKKHIPMKKIPAPFLAACIIVGLGCHWVGVRGNGHLKTDQRTISAFATVDASGTFTIEWRNGPPALSITTDENLLPYIDNQVSGDALHLHTRENIWPTHGIKVVISSSTRTGAKISGARSEERRVGKRERGVEGV